MTSILKLDNIQNASGTSAISIDSGGRILTPARPAWSAYLSIQQSTTDYTIAAPVPFDTEDFDIGGNLTVDTTNGAVFTAPITGLYQFNTMVQVQNLTASGYAELTMYVDDAYVGGSVDFSYRHLEDVQGGTFQTATQSSVIQLTANQTLTPYVIINGDTTIEVRAGCRFNGFLVG